MVGFKQHRFRLLGVLTIAIVVGVGVALSNTQFVKETPSPTPSDAQDDVQEITPAAPAIRRDVADFVQVQPAVSGTYVSTELGVAFDVPVSWGALHTYSDTRYSGCYGIYDAEYYGEQAYAVMTQELTQRPYDWCDEVTVFFADEVGSDHDIILATKSRLYRKYPPAVGGNWASIAADFDAQLQHLCGSQASRSCRAFKNRHGVEFVETTVPTEPDGPMQTIYYVGSPNPLYSVVILTPGINRTPAEFASVIDSFRLVPFKSTKSGIRPTE